MLAWLKFLRLAKPLPLERSVGSGTLVRMTALALVLLAVAVALAQIRNGPSVTAVEPDAVAVDPLASDLARCRTVTPQELAADDTCQRVWAESRRRFFTPSASRRNPAIADPAGTGSAMPPRIQDRIPSDSVPDKPIEGR